MTTKNRRRPTDLQPDHHLNALLQFINGCEDLDQFDAVNAIAHRALNDDDNEDLIDRVFGFVTKDAAKSPADAEEAKFLREALSNGDDDITVTNSEAAFDTLVYCVSRATMVGAVMMYRLLNGGAK